jgi:hypothetical protein
MPREREHGIARAEKQHSRKQEIGVYCKGIFEKFTWSLTDLAKLAASFPHPV